MNDAPTVKTWTRRTSRWFDRLQTGQQLATAAVVLQVLLIVTVAFDTTATFVAGPRIPLAMTSLTLLPGGLLLALLGHDLDRLESLLYAVMTSLSLVMATLLVLNAVYISFPIVEFEPVTEIGLVVVTSVLVGGFSYGLFRTERNPAIPSASEFTWLFDVYPAYVLSLPVAALCGAILVQWNVSNVPALLVLLLIALTPLFAISQPARSQGLTVWAVSLALLLQNVFMTRYLTGGDAPQEFYFANIVIHQGYWNPELVQPPNGLLRIVFLHPAYSILGDIPLTAEFKLINTFVVSLLPVAIYLIGARAHSDRVGLVGAFFYMFLPSFFTIVSWNTRTGVSLVFASVLVLLVLDQLETERSDSYLLLILLFGLIVSHYGTVVFMLIVFGFAFVVGVLDSTWLEENRFAKLGPFTLIIGLGLFLWYSYASSGVVVNFLFITITTKIIVPLWILAVEFLQPYLGIDLPVPAGQFGNPSAVSRATEGIVSGGSSTYLLTRLFGIFIAISMALGYLLATLKHVSVRVWNRSEESQFDNEVLALGAGGALLITGGLLPVSTVGIDRILLTGGIILFPFGAYFLFSLGLTVVPDTNLVGTAIAVFLAVVLLVNAGVVSATVLHDQSLQPNLQRDHIMKDGTESEVNHLYAKYRPTEEIAASEWLLTHGGEDPLVVGSSTSPVASKLLLTEYDPSDPPGVRSNHSRAAIGEGYLYLTSQQHVLGNVTLQTADGPREIPLSELPLQEQSRIYDNGQTGIYR